MDSHQSDKPVITKHSDKPVIVVLACLIVAYAVATAFGWTRHLELEEAAAAETPHLWAVLPFTLLLGAIAVLPLMEGAAHWWERNLNKFYVAANLALVTLLYLAFLHPTASLSFCHAHAVSHDRQRVHSLYRAVVQPVHDQRRHPHRRRSTGPSAHESIVPGGGRLAGQLHRHHGGRDVTGGSRCRWKTQSGSGNTLPIRWFSSSL